MQVAVTQGQWSANLCSLPASILCRQGVRKDRVPSDMPVWAVKSDYNPVEEPSWNSAASFAIGALQNGASWLSPLGSGAPAMSPSRGASQREQSEVHLLS